MLTVTAIRGSHKRTVSCNEYTVVGSQHGTMVTCAVWFPSETKETQILVSGPENVEGWDVVFVTNQSGKTIDRIGGV